MTINSLFPVVPNFIPADYPACKAWLRCNEGSGAVLADAMSKIADMAITDNGAEDPWAAAFSFTTSDTAAAEIFATLLYSSATSLQLGTRDLIVELDLSIPAAPAAQTGLIGYGRVYNNNDGWAIEINTGGRVQMKAREGGVIYNPNMNIVSALPVATRIHVTLAWDRSTGNTHAYFEGIEDGNSPFNYDALDETVDIQTTGGNLEVGKRLQSATYIDATFYNLRVWMPAAGLPSNMSTVAADMAANPDEFPTTMENVA